MTRYLKIRERGRWIVLRGGSFTQFCFSSVSSFSSLPFAGTWSNFGQPLSHADRLLLTGGIENYFIFTAKRRSRQNAEETQTRFEC